MADVKLVQLGAAAVGRRDELAARAPAEASNCVALHRDGTLRLSTGGRERPGFVGARALIGHDGEGLGIRRKCERGATGEAPRGVGNARQALARVEVRKGTLGHDDGCYSG